MKLYQKYTVLGDIIIRNGTKMSLRYFSVPMAKNCCSFWTVVSREMSRWQWNLHFSLAKPSYVVVHSTLARVMPGSESVLKKLANFSFQKSLLQYSTRGETTSEVFSDMMCFECPIGNLDFSFKVDYVVHRITEWRQWW